MIEQTDILKGLKNDKDVTYIADLTLDPLSHLQKLHHRSMHDFGAYSGPTYSQTDRLNFII